MIHRPFSSVVVVKVGARGVLARDASVTVAAPAHVQEVIDTTGAGDAFTAGFLPALMLSGFVFEIASMPLPLRFLTHLIPARYFATSLQSLFQAGGMGVQLAWNALGLLILALVWLGLTARATRRTLD